MNDFPIVIFSLSDRTAYLFYSGKTVTYTGEDSIEGIPMSFSFVVKAKLGEKVYNRVAVGIRGVVLDTGKTVLFPFKGNGSGITSYGWHGFKVDFDLVTILGEQGETLWKPIDEIVPIEDKFMGSVGHDSDEPYSTSMAASNCFSNPELFIIKPVWQLPRKRQSGLITDSDIAEALRGVSNVALVETQSLHQTSDRLSSY